VSGVNIKGVEPTPPPFSGPRFSSDVTMPCKKLVTVEIVGIFVIFRVISVQVFHAVVRIVRSNPIITAMQVSSRLFLVWGILWLVPEVGNMPFSACSVNQHPFV